MPYADRGSDRQNPPTEEEAIRLREEVEDLRRRLQEHEKTAKDSGHAATGGAIWRPSAGVIWGICLVLAVLAVAAFFVGYLPMRARNSLIRGEAAAEATALPRVDVIQVRRSSVMAELDLPGNIEAITEAPILARADGYLEKRLVDIGDRVQAGQLVAEIAAPELDEQVRQLKAAVEQSREALDQAQANLKEGVSNRELARITAERWAQVVAKGAVSRQENDQYQAQYQARIAAVQALEKAVAAQKSNVTQAEANLAHINEIQDYRHVKAPFAGVITQRNVDVGALVNTGSTLLYRIAQTGTLRIFVNVPQTNADAIRPGQGAVLKVSNLPGRIFSGKVVRTANSLDPTSRTMLTEVQVPNSGGVLLPGMYARVQLSEARLYAPLVVPGDSLQINADGTKVALVRTDHTVHFQPVEVGRDYGDRLEIISGLAEGDTIIPRPGDIVHEGTKVEPVAPKTR